MSKSRKFIFSSFSIACIVAILTCFIVDYAINGYVSWSVYPLLSVVLGWLVLCPLLIKKRGVLLSLCSLTLFTLPYLFLLEKTTPVTDWFMPLGIPSAAVGIPAVWAIALVFRYLKISLWYKSAVAVFIAGVLANFIISYNVDMYLYGEPHLLSPIITSASCLVLSVALVIQGRNRAAAKKREIAYSVPPAPGPDAPKQQ